MEDSPSPFTSIIIGGGLSGLSCGLHLKDNGDDDFVVLEARDRIGGRLVTADVTADGVFHTTCDAGGAYVGPTQLEIYKVFTDGESVVMDANHNRSTYEGDIPKLGFLSLLDVNALLVKLDALSEEVPVVDPWKWEKAEQYDVITVRAWIEQQGWMEESKLLVRAAFQSLVCAPACEVSMLWFLWFLRSGDGITRMTRVARGAQERKVVGGTQGLCEAIRDELGAQKLKLGMVVKEIDFSGKQVVVTCTNAEDEIVRFCAPNVVVAFSPSLYTSVEWKPGLPTQKSQLAMRMPVGSIFKTNMYYKNAFWREKGLNGEVVNLANSPVVWCCDDTKPDGSKPSIMGFISSTSFRDLEDLTKEERMKIVAEYYSKAFESKEALEPVAYNEMNWCAERFSRGCYLSYCTPKTLTSFGPHLRSAIQDKVFFASTETATHHSGYMDGAIQAGQRAACEILGVEFEVTAEYAGVIPNDPLKPSRLEKMAPMLVKALILFAAAMLSIFLKRTFT